MVRILQSFAVMCFCIAAVLAFYYFNNDFAPSSKTPGKAPQESSPAANRPVAPPVVADEDGKTILDYVSQGDFEKVFDTISQTPASVNARNPYGQRLIHLAASSCHMDIFSYLLLNGADLSSKDNDGRYPAHWAAMNGCLPALDYSYKNGINLSTKDRAGFTPLIYAAMFGREDEVSYLIPIVNSLDTKNNKGESALILATKNHIGYPKVTQLLLDSGADKNIKDNDGKTALDWAHELERKEIEEQLAPGQFEESFF